MLARSQSSIVIAPSGRSARSAQSRPRPRKSSPGRAAGRDPAGRPCDATDPEAEAGVLDKARFVQSLDGLRGVKMRRFGHWSFRQ